ncbi:MAG: ATPase [Flavobacterium sp. BFFFF2]|nr:MAG: ATPase [Flavobacterium sp. BFFFF2]
MPHPHIEKTYQTIINTSVSKLWNALIDPDQVKQYFFGTQQASSFAVGSPITWQGEFDGKTYLDKGVILDFQPEKRLAYSYISSWIVMEDIPENYLTVCFSIQPTEDHVVLLIRFTSYDEARAEQSEKSWEMIVNQLKALVE